MSAAALLVDPVATLRALDALDARSSLHKFCGVIEIPGAPVEDDDDVNDEDGDNASVVAAYRPIETPQAAHHKLLIDVLEAVDSGHVARAMLFLPPGSAKSTYASVVFPAWFLGRKRGRNVILGTYGSGLARKLGRRGRSIVRQLAYSTVFGGVTLSPDSGAADEWALTNGNEFMAGGIRSGMTGNRGDLLLIDDPIKGREQADSETVRMHTREAYEDDLLTRLKPGGRIVLIQTRWHEEDLAGGILPMDYDGRSGWVLCRDGLWWYIVNVPAQAERADDPLGRKPGEMLWPEWFDEAHWSLYRNNPRTWAALYQQRPSPEAGTYFQRDWFRSWVALPDLYLYGTSDFATTEDGGDYTVHHVWGVDVQGDLYLVDKWREQTTSDVWVERGLDLIVKWKPFAWFVEKGVIWSAVKPVWDRRQRERKAWCRIEEMPSLISKIGRARGLQAMAAGGRVWLQDSAEGIATRDELTKFPAGRYDDEVDAASMICRALEDAHPAIVQWGDAPGPSDRYKKRREKPKWAR